MVFGALPLIGANAAPGDDAEALGSFLNADLLPVDAADLATAYASFPTGPEGEADPFNLAVLQSLGLEVSLTGDGLLELPLLTDGTGPGLLDLGELGAVNSFASTPSPIESIAASGAVSDDGTIAVSETAAPGDFGNATLNLTDLLDQLGVAAVTDAVIDEAAIEIGALASRAVDAPGAEPTSDYRVTDLGIELHSPAVAALADTLRGTLDVAATDLTGTLEALAGPGGAVTGVVDAISDVNLLGVASVSLGDADISVTPPDLATLVDDVLGGPGASVVSDDGAVTVDLTDGTISVDLATLVNPGGPNLNGLPANTPVLTTDTIELITAGVTNALGKVVGNVTAGLETAIESTALTIGLDLDVTALPALGGLPLVDAPILITGTLADFAAGTATVDTSQLTLLPGAPLCLGATVAGVCVGVDVNTLLGAVLDLVVDTLVPTVLAGVVGPLADVATAAADEITGALDTVIADALGVLAPAVDGLLTNIVDVTINEQPAVGDLGADSFTVRALSVTLLPNLAGSSLATLNLASSTVTALDALPGPMLTDLAPAEGPTDGGTDVTLTGTDLGDATSVTVDGVDVPFTVVSDTEITFETPAHAPGVVDVVVASPAGPSNALPFEYVPAPDLATLVPDQGPATGGTEVTVTGTDLGGAIEVAVDGEPVAFTQISDTELTFVTPPHAAGPADVTVETVGGVSDPLVFTYLPAPVLLGLDPDAGPIAGGTDVTLTGEELGDATEVVIDGVPVPFDQISDTEITFETPAHAPGTVDVVVTTDGGTTNALPFTYVAPPALAALTPDAGPTDGGQTVTVTGTDLANAIEVTIDGDAVPFTQVSGTELTFVTPAHDAGEVDVTVETAGGVTDPLGYTYVPVPVTTGLDPEAGPTAGGTLVTIEGTDLGAVTEVTIDGAPVGFTVVSDTEIEFVTPAHAPGTVDVVVTSAGGSSDPLEYTYVAAPVLTGLDPDAGPIAGGTEVTIGGTDLDGATEVTVGGQPVSFTPVSDTEIVIETPASPAGPADIVVTTPGGTSNPLPFQFLNEPALVSLAPDAGPASGGTLVTITGTDLADALEVAVDGDAVPFTQVSDTEVTFVTPPHAAGEVDVTVTTAGGESDPLTFTYLPAVVDPAPGDGDTGEGTGNGTGTGTGTGPGAGTGTGTGAGTAGSGSIASTGFDVLIPVFGALLILMGGAAFLLVARRRAGER